MKELQTQRRVEMDLYKAFGFKKEISGHPDYSENIPPLDHSRDYDREIAFHNTEGWQKNMPPGVTPETFKEMADQGKINFAALPTAFDPLNNQFDNMYTKPILGKLKRGESITDREREVFSERQKRYLDHNKTVQMDRVVKPAFRGNSPRLRRQRDSEHEVWQTRMDQMGVGVGQEVRERYPDAYRNPDNGQIMIPKLSEYGTDVASRHPDWMKDQIDNPDMQPQLGDFNPHKRPSPDDPDSLPMGHGVDYNHLTDSPITKMVRKANGLI